MFSNSIMSIEWPPFPGPSLVLCHTRAFPRVKARPTRWVFKRSLFPQFQDFIYIVWQATNIFSGDPRPVHSLSLLLYSRTLAEVGIGSHARLTTARKPEHSILQKTVSIWEKKSTIRSQGVRSIALFQARARDRGTQGVCASERKKQTQHTRHPYCAYVQTNRPCRGIHAMATSACNFPIFGKS